MLEIKNLTCCYGKNEILHGVDISFKKGHFTVITGVNGSGKSTLLSCIAGVKDYKGSIFIDEKELKKIPVAERAKKVSYLPQSVKSVPFTVRELVSFGRNPYGDLRWDEGIKNVENALRVTELLKLSDKKVTELSGGQKQLCYFAMVVCRNAEIVLLDEASSGLDAKREELIYSVARDMCQKDNKTVVAVMHNLSNAVRFADDVAVLENGNSVFFGSKEECIEKEIFEKHFGVKRFTWGNGAEERIFYSR